VNQALCLQAELPGLTSAALELCSVPATTTPARSRSRLFAQQPQAWLTLPRSAIALQLFAVQVASPASPPAVWRWSGSDAALSPDEPSSGWFDLLADGSSQLAWADGTATSPPANAYASVGLVQAGAAPDPAVSARRCPLTDPDDAASVLPSKLQSVAASEAGSTQLKCACEVPGAQPRSTALC
jgi:hypothetical protein